MTGLVDWIASALAASTVLMLLVLALRSPLRRWIGPQPAYWLWALPALRMALPPLPAIWVADVPLAGAAATAMSVLATGPRGTPQPGDAGHLTAALLVIWAAGAVVLIVTYGVRHIVFCRRLHADGTVFGRAGATPILATSVDGPLAFGVVRRVIAVPVDFATAYTAHERDLAVAHEHAHHARGDLLANWVSLAVLAAHWWNPVAWVAIRAFHDDQEFAADAHVLARREPAEVPDYARVLAKAAGIGALPACNLTPRSNLKGRLMMLRHTPRARHPLVLGGLVLMLFGGAAIASTAAGPGAASATGGTQAVTIGVKPDGSGGYALIVGGAVIAAGAPLPGGKTLPADFSKAGGCDLKPGAKPFAMVIKGTGGTTSYSVMCASAAPAPLRATLAEGLTSLNTMRASVATQQATAAFPEAERAHALGAIDRSIREVKAALAARG